MKNTKLLLTLATVAASLWTAATASAADVVNDTWLDGNRTDPATTEVTGPYSENGADADADGDLESVWYSSPGAALVASAGHLNMDNTNGGANTGSSSYTTFFTPEATPVTLAQGETLKVTWVFTPTGVGTNTGRGLRMALVNTAGDNRRTTDGSPSNSTYTGYRISLNVAQTLISNTLELRERVQFASDNLLVNDDRWSGGIASVGADGATGMVDGTEYTVMWSIKRTLADEMEIAASVTGGNYAGTGSLELAFTDTTANGDSFTFDTFALRPSSAVATANAFDTTLIRVEHIPIPEPASVAMLGLAGIAMTRIRRRR
jgi:hypothetical protein